MDHFRFGSLNFKLTFYWILSETLTILLCFQHDVSEKYEERSCIRAELRKRKKKLSEVAISSNNSGIGNKNSSLALPIETPLTNGFATPRRTLGHGVGSKSMGVSELGKEVRQNDERYDNIRDEKILQSMVRGSFSIFTADMKSEINYSICLLFCKENLLEILLLRKSVKAEGNLRRSCYISSFYM